MGFSSSLYFYSLLPHIPPAIRYVHTEPLVRSRLKVSLEERNRNVKSAVRLLADLLVVGVAADGEAVVAVEV